MVRNICLYLQEQELLLAADELRLRVLGGELAGPWDAAPPDMPLALRSLLKLKDLTGTLTESLL